MLEYRPQLATLVEKAPDGEAWLHELKYDGWRMGALVERGKVRLISRNGKDWTDVFPEVVAGLRELPYRRLLVDGEICVMLPDGRTSFQALQNAVASRERPGLVYFIFDLLALGARDLTALPLEERKRELRHVLAASGDPLRFADHIAGHGPRVFADACHAGLEGIISKRRDQPHRAGRGAGWLKTKCLLRQELVIGGFTDPEGGRAGIGALLVGVQEGGRLRFAGKVGTGYTIESSRALRRRLDALEQKDAPFADKPRGWLGKHAHWVRPELVAEVAFGEWTRDGKVRHASFQGLREDKPPREVVRERPAVAGVRVSHPERVVYAKLGLTKLDVVRYYESVAERMLPHLAGRPLTLVRCPNGVGEDCHYARHSLPGIPTPEVVKRVQVSLKQGGSGEFMVVDSAEALVALAQMNIIELHTWNSRAEALERPDRIIFDLDPGPDVRWADVVRGALRVREVLAALGLVSFLKTTGGVGLHVVVPLAPERSWQECADFSQAVATLIAREEPRRYTTEMKRAGREKKIFVDWLRNVRAATSVSAWSARARAEATVSMPLAWEELSARVKPGRFTVLNALEREDAWRDYIALRQRFGAGTLDAIGAPGRG